MRRSLGISPSGLNSIVSTRITPKIPDVYSGTSICLRKTKSLTPIVQRLERDGWIRRTCDPTDRRRQLVWLTERSRDQMPRIGEDVERYRQESLRGLSQEETDTLSELLARMEANLL